MRAVFPSGVFVDVKITDDQAERLKRGESVELDLCPDEEVRRYTVEDLGFTSPRRVHVDSVKHPNPAVDTKRIADALRGGFHYKGTTADLNVGPEFDPVERPEHYVDGREIEPIDVIDDWTLGFYEGQVLKHIARAGRKTDSELEDLRKAKFYLDRLVKLVAEDEGGENDRT